MPLKNRNHFPNGGFSFYIPQSKWRATGGLSFAMVVDEIIKHRKANPHLKQSTVKSVVEDELDAFTCARLNHNEQWCTQKKTGIPMELTIPPFENSLPPPVEDAPPVVVEVHEDVKPVLISWIGSGLKPVAKDVAEQRASICAKMPSEGYKKCPMNVSGTLLQRVKGVVGEVIHATMELKAGLRLSTTNDALLGTCDACGCSLPLKVWVPNSIIAQDTSEEVFNRLHKSCWIRSLRQS